MPLSNSINQGIKSIQSGIVVMASYASSGSVVISTINVSKSAIEITGISSGSNDLNPCVAITGPTSLSWERSIATGLSKFSWQIVEYQ